MKPCVGINAVTFQGDQSITGVGGNDLQFQGFARRHLCPGKFDLQFGVAIQRTNVNQSVPQWLAGLENCISGVTASVKRTSNGGYLAVRSGWPSNPNSMGSYTC